MPSHEHEVLGTYQRDIGNLRSHHWKHWVDLYTNCYFDCAYCVYRAAGEMGRVEAHPERVDALARDLARLSHPGITYLGPRADIYQPLDRKHQLARRALEVFLELGRPVFLVTRAPLVLRDVDILRRLAARGLVEVSVTIASPQTITDLEPHTPTVDERLALVAELVQSGVPTSVHLSPILPHLDEAHALGDLLGRIGDSGAACAYACVLGMREEYRPTITAALSSAVEPARRVRLLAAYPERTGHDGVQSAPNDYVLSLMRHLSEHATTRSIPFACVHLPELDTTERHGGIFRHKLPTVGDIVRHLTRGGAHEVRFATLEAFLRRFSAVDDDFIDSVGHFWKAGILFKNTTFHPVGDPIEAYARGHAIDLAISNMAVR